MNTKRITTLKNWKWRDWFGSVEWSLELNLDIGMNSIIMNNGWLIMVYWVQANVILWLIKCVMNTWLDWMDILKWWRRDTRRIQWDPKSPDWFSALEVQWIILHTICWEVLSLYVKNGIDSHFESSCLIVDIQWRIEKTCNRIWVRQIEIESSLHQTIFKEGQ